MKIFFRKILRCMGILIPMQTISKDISALEPRFLEYPLYSDANSIVAHAFGLMLYPETDTEIEGFWSYRYQPGGWRPVAIGESPDEVVNMVARNVKDMYILPG